MDGKFKFLLLVALILYVASPIDLVPGPIDDIILCLAYVVTRRRISAQNAPDDIEENEYWTKFRVEPLRIKWYDTQRNKASGNRYLQG